jgi:aspartokinase-like uncharacterized kinase
MTQAPQDKWVAFPLASSGTVTDTSVKSAIFKNFFYKGALVVVNRKSETGASTLAVKLVGYLRDDDKVEYEWDVQGAAIVTFADGATGVRYFMVYPGATGSDADGVIAKGTNYNLVNDALPQQFRIVATHGGTSVENTFSVRVYPLT